MVRPRALVGLLALAALLAGVAYSGSNSASVSSPLDGFGLHGKAYRCMNITATYVVSNTLRGVSPPPWYPDYSASPPASLSCPGFVLGEGSYTTLVDTAWVPCSAGLGVNTVSTSLVCSYTAWWRSVTTKCLGWFNGTCTETSTTTVTDSWAETTTIELHDTFTVVPRRINSSLLPVELDVTGYEPLGNGSVVATITVKLYNLGLGLRLGNKTPIPVQEGMLLLYNLTVLVNGVPAISIPGYGAPARAIPANTTGNLVPSATGSATLTLAPPGRPANQYTFNITICYTEDKPEPTKTCFSDNVTAPLPFGWRLVRYVADDCSVLNETWEVVPANETGYETILVRDAVKPSITTKDYCIVAAAGACEPIRLLVYENGSLIASRTGRGSATWCPVEPGVYTVAAVDGFNNTATGAYTLTWTAGPPPVLKQALQGLAGAIIALVTGLYIIFGGRWPLRGV